MATESKENYIKCIFKLHKKGVKISVSAIAQALSISLPSTNSMIKNLHEMGWIKYEKYKAIEITPKGISKAKSIIRKHRITEMFLVEKMGFAWNEVHDIAEEMEHIASEALFDRMDALLNFPDFDPHGSPIPKKDGEMRKRSALYLHELEPGEKASFLSPKNNSDIKPYFKDFDIPIGEEFLLLNIDSYDQSRTLQFKNKQIEISSILAHQLQISPVKE